MPSHTTPTGTPQPRVRSLHTTLLHEKFNKGEVGVAGGGQAAGRAKGGGKDGAGEYFSSETGIGRENRQQCGLEAADPDVRRGRHLRSLSLPIGCSRPSGNGHVADNFQTESPLLVSAPSHFVTPTLLATAHSEDGRWRGKRVTLTPGSETPRPRVRRAVQTNLAYDEEAQESRASGASGASGGRGPREGRQGARSGKQVIVTPRSETPQLPTKQVLSTPFDANVAASVCPNSGIAWVRGDAWALESEGEKEDKAASSVEQEAKVVMEQSTSVEEEGGAAADVQFEGDEQESGFISGEQEEEARDFDMNELATLNSRLAEIELEETFHPSPVRLQRPLDEPRFLARPERQSAEDGRGVAALESGAAGTPDTGDEKQSRKYWEKNIRQLTDQEKWAFLQRVEQAEVRVALDEPVQIWPLPEDRLLFEDQHGEQTVTGHQFLAEWAGLHGTQPPRRVPERAVRLGAVDDYPWRLTPADIAKNQAVFATIVEEEKAKGMGGMLWRSELVRRIEALQEGSMQTEKHQDDFFQLVDEVPFRGGVDDTDYPPGRGVGDNVNKTREAMEAVQDEVIAAAIDGNREAIKRLSADPFFSAVLDLRDYSVPADGPTPLHYAIHSNRSDAAEMLLELGADVNKGDRAGATPLHYCAARNRVLLASSLLARGADPNTADAATGASPLHLAACHGSTEMVRVLCAAGADVNQPDGMTEETPLFDAAKEGWTDTVVELLEHGADPCVLNDLFCPPYFVAQEWNHWETAEVLIEAMGDKYVKLEPFKLPPRPRAMRRGGREGEGLRDESWGAEEEE